MSRLTNDTDAINQAVSQNVTALLASVLSMVGILIAMFVLNLWLALARCWWCRSCWVHRVCGPLHPQGLSRSCRPAWARQQP